MTCKNKDFECTSIYSFIYLFIYFRDAQYSSACISADIFLVFFIRQYLFCWQKQLNIKAFIYSNNTFQCRRRQSNSVSCVWFSMFLGGLQFAKHAAISWKEEKWAYWIQPILTEMLSLCQRQDISYNLWIHLYFTCLSLSYPQVTWVLVIDILLNLKILDNITEYSILCISYLSIYLFEQGHTVRK